MIVREKRADIIGAEGERRESGRAAIGMDVLRWKRGEEDGAM